VRSLCVAGGDGWARAGVRRGSLAAAIPTAYKRAMSDEHPARAASKRSVQAVRAKAREAWLDLFAADAVIEDPVGVSPIDPTGNGHRGRAAIAAFWDKQIAPVTIDFDVRESYAGGNECANVGTINIGMANGMKARVDGVFVYRVNEAGKLVSMRAFWDFERMLASMTTA
jgi:steroid delta-isomerase